MTGKLPTIIITGASGFVGRAMLDELKADYHIFAIARRSQQESKAPVHPNIAWMRADIGEYQSIADVFREIATAGGADYLLHLAAFYEFAALDHPEYVRTNVEGTRHVLELAGSLKLKRFIFVSSVAACSFPKKGGKLNESSKTDGRHKYSWSKNQGEKMVRSCANKIPSCIVRLGAVYSDWCEYPPLYVFLNTWLSSSLKSNILAGKGESSVPYIHIRNLVSFFRQVLQQHEKLKPAEVLIASPSGSTTHKALFARATRYFFGKTKKPILMPRLLCGIGLSLQYFWGWVTGNLPFECPWMYHYIDLQLNINSSYTCSKLGWSPDLRYDVERRLPFLIERLKSEPFAWHARNVAAMTKVSTRPHVAIYETIADMEEEIVEALIELVKAPEGNELYPNYEKMDTLELRWTIKLIYRLLLTSIDNDNRMLILNYLEISVRSRFEAGFSGDEIIRLMTRLNLLIKERLRKLEKFRQFDREIYDTVSTPIEFGIDEVEYQYHLFQKPDLWKQSKEQATTPLSAKTAREQLEETIWNCLVQRK
ncbi:MAG: NAD-dependent epimerase/dehydratase family protein [candidate division Zixibacteria bacterium]|nr:NAD-dependent epimerase/dehydratase family protein [candidate division Zixibacteria bacterium]